jgi:lipopolysaccharide/colanic/teichoic acid biosynthesis glycosyltransferase
MYFFIKRILDILITSIGIILFFPVIIAVSLIILISSGYPVFFLQERVGKDWKIFKIVKFRTMVKNADKMGSGVSSHDDYRITNIGKFLRRFKIDEIPQIFNVLLGDMSLVGPRPELLKYAEYYLDDYSEILKIKPGITDYASLEFRNESELLRHPDDNEKIYLNKILPDKIKLYKKYLKEANLTTDIKIIFSTFKVIIR